jgi:hypothetical protein
MRPVVVLILQPEPRAGAGSALAGLEAARETLVDAHSAAFREIGIEDIRVVRERHEPWRPFGERVREQAERIAGEGRGRQTGLIILGAGSIPLARREDYEAFARAATGRARRALANSYYSADAIAIPDARMLVDVPDLPSDNALPRWLSELAGIPVADLRDRSRLAMDLDSPLDVVLVAFDRGCPPRLALLADVIRSEHPGLVGAIEGVRRVLADRRAELLLAGRTSARTVAWLEQHAACRVRALVEERGLRASSPMALGPLDTDTAPPGEPDRVAEPDDVERRPPHSVLGMLLDAHGAAALPTIVGRLSDAAVIDSRVLLAHRLGADEGRWPEIDDRLSSDLLRPDDVDDPWLRGLTTAAANSPVPILLGGHSVVGPGIPLLGARLA